MGNIRLEERTSEEDVQDYSSELLKNKKIYGSNMKMANQ